VDPLFYKFTPLEDEGLKKDIKKITEKAGIVVSNFLVADAAGKQTGQCIFYRDRQYQKNNNL